MAGLRVILGGVTAVLAFFLNLIIGINIAADPGNIDTGLVAFLFIPVYAVAAVLMGGFAFRFGQRLRQRPYSTNVWGGWRGWLLAGLVALFAGIYTMRLMVELLHLLVDKYLIWSLLSVPLLLALTFGVMAAMFRLFQTAVSSMRSGKK